MSPAASGSLPARVLVAGLFLPVLALALRAGGWWFFALVTLIALAGAAEFVRCMDRAGARSRGWGELAVGGAVLLAFERAGLAGGAAVLTLGALGLMAAALARHEDRGVASRAAAALFGVLYLPWMLGHLLLLRNVAREAPAPDVSGTALASLAFLLAWSSDTGAYFIGRWIGRRRLAPAISPGKTVEGAVGGLLCCVAAALAARGPLVPWLGWADAAALGVVVGILAPIGDLVESGLKREAGIKDASRLIPGHGGVLDRFDSLVFAAPAVYYWFRFVLSRA